MQIHTEAPDHGLKILFEESDVHEDPDEYEGEKETTGEGERDSSRMEELRRILKEKASIPHQQRRLRMVLYFFLCLHLPVKIIAPVNQAVMAGEVAESVVAYAARRKFKRMEKKVSEDCDARLDAVLAKFSTGERDRILWSLRCAGLMDECK